MSRVSFGLNQFFKMLDIILITGQQMAGRVPSAKDWKEHFLLQRIWTWMITFM